MCSVDEKNPYFTSQKLLNHRKTVRKTYRPNNLCLSKTVFLILPSPLCLIEKFAFFNIVIVVCPVRPVKAGNFKCGVIPETKTMKNVQDIFDKKTTTCRTNFFNEIFSGMLSNKFIKTLIIRGKSQMGGLCLGVFHRGCSATNNTCRSRNGRFLDWSTRLEIEVA